LPAIKFAKKVAVSEHPLPFKLHLQVYAGDFFRKTRQGLVHVVVISYFYCFENFDKFLLMQLVLQLLCLYFSSQ